MLDIKLIRAEADMVKAAMSRRGEDIDVDAIISLDDERRRLLYQAEQLKARQNAVSKQIPIYKKEGRDLSDVFSEMKEISEKIKGLDGEIRAVQAALLEMLLTVPNIPNPAVPDGADDEDNIELRKWGEIPSFEYPPKAHWDIGEELDILDFAAAAKITGARFTVYKGLGAGLERAVINYFLDKHTRENGYSEILPPFLVHRNSMTGTGQLPKFEEDAFKIAGSEYFLIPTAEVPVTNLYRETVIDSGRLPIRHVAYSACFRSEAGSAGRDTRGLIRQHQFNKIELVKLTKPEDSYAELESLTRDAESVLKGLGLPYRVVKICVGDLGFAAALKYDIEVWMPSYGRYVEISSCSNFEEFQARRAGIRFREPTGERPNFVHTLNGSGVAVGRAVAAILENYQQSDGSIVIPPVLRGYMGGIEKLSVGK